MCEIYSFLQLANPFGHPSQVRTQVLVLQTCVDLHRLASPFVQGVRGFILKEYTVRLEAFMKIRYSLKTNFSAHLRLQYRLRVTTADRNTPQEQ